ncbi:MAG: hypothetical protein AAF573_02180 [Bacteroidota bacterium]
MRHFWILFFLFYLSFSTQGQNFNSFSTFFKKKYIDAPYVEAGGMFLPLSATTFNFHVGFGYQFTTFSGIGISYSTASSYGGFDDKFNGFGIDYRIHADSWWMKNTAGFVNDYFPSNKTANFEYAQGERNRFFYRCSFGWIPRNGVIKFGLVYHLTDQATFTDQCPVGSPGCLSDNRRVGNLQLYVGVHLPNPNRKNLERTLLRK